MKMRIELELDMEAYAKAYPDMEVPSDEQAMEMARSVLSEGFWDWQQGRKGIELSGLKISITKM